MINLIIFIVLYFMDLYFKNYVSANLKWHGKISFLSDYLQIIYVENRGIAFNFLENKKSIIYTANVILLTYILYLYFHVGVYKFPLMLIFCGGFGNLTDRIKRGYVVDYIYFKIKKSPVFNLSDFYIIIGAILFSF